MRKPNGASPDVRRKRCFRRASGCWFATAAVVRARYSFSAQQSWEGSTTAFGRSSRAPPLLQPWRTRSLRPQKSSSATFAPSACTGRLAHHPGDAAVPPGAARLLNAWQRRSEPGPAARAEAVVASPGTNRPGCARSRQGTEFAESRFRASRVTFLRRQRPYRRSLRSRSRGCCSAKAKRSSHRCRDKRCSVSSRPTASSSVAGVAVR
jgi:hypothetical protein